MCVESNFNAECQFIPGYTGFCPEYEQHVGSSYGRITQEAITGRHNYLTTRLSPTKCYPNGRIKPNVCDRYQNSATACRDQENVCISTEEFATGTGPCDGRKMNFQVFSGPGSQSNYGFPTRFCAKIVECGPLLKASEPDGENVEYVSEFRISDLPLDRAETRYETTEIPLERSKVWYKTTEIPVARVKPRIIKSDPSFDKEATKLKITDAALKKRGTKYEISGDPDAEPCDGYCQRVSVTSMRPAGLPSDWQEEKEENKAKQKKKEYDNTFDVDQRSPERAYRTQQVKYGCLCNQRMKGADYRMPEGCRGQLLKSPEYGESSALDPEEGFPVSLTIHLPNCRPSDKIEIPNVYRSNKMAAKKNSRNSPCRPKMATARRPEELRAVRPQKFSSEKPCMMYQNSSDMMQEGRSSGSLRQKSPANPSSPTGRYGSAARRRKCSAPKCSGGIKVIPKYTGYITGLKWTYGETYGKAADRLLGNRPECLEKYIVCDNYWPPPNYCRQ